MGTARPAARAYLTSITMEPIQAGGKGRRPSRNRARRQGVQAELATAWSPGNVTLHPAALVATNVAVVGCASVR
jgi:hypothetical protein